MNRINGTAQAFEYQIALAEFDLAQGNIPDAVHLLEQLASSATTRERAVAAQVKLADIHLNNKNFDAAEALATEILGKDNRNVDGLRLRASIRMQRGQLDNAGDRGRPSGT